MCCKQSSRHSWWITGSRFLSHLIHDLMRHSYVGFQADWPTSSTIKRAFRAFHRLGRSTGTCDSVKLYAPFRVMLRYILMTQKASIPSIFVGLSFGFWWVLFFEANFNSITSKFLSLTLIMERFWVPTPPIWGSHFGSLGWVFFRANFELQIFNWPLFLLVFREWIENVRECYCTQKRLSTYGRGGHACSQKLTYKFFEI